MDEIEQTRGLTVDGVLRRAAERDPSAIALRAGSLAWTFAELDAEVSAAADAVAAVTAPGEVVAVASALRPEFAVAYLGVLRAGRVVAVVSPFGMADTVADNLRRCGATLAILEPNLVSRLRPAQVPGIRVVAHGDPLPAPIPDAPVAPTLGDPAVCCLLFTSGTTGTPKIVQLTHHNLVVNAFQTADSHHVGTDAVCANALPSFHLMHLTSALWAGAEQVLLNLEDPVDAYEAAVAAGVTHLYTIPAKLATVAGDPRALTRSATLRAVLSGGSALPPGTAEALGSRLGVPIVQGYGMAETSPLTFSDRPDSGVVGSVGTPVAGTRARIVDVGSREVLEPEQTGELEVRGPQVMVGYLDVQGGLRADGWLATGDIGRLTADGRLFLTDRLKDIFKYDNWIVAPSVIEARLRPLRVVADTLVVDVPDEVHGAAAGALVVPAAGATEEDVVAAVRSLNDDLAYYERVRVVRAVAELPRSPKGKLDRRRARASLTEPDATRSLAQTTVTEGA